ncbi:MAG: D-glycero-beta-D-manno-heptose 1,7-bisphosphate 7-phosphatase [Kiritimatiellaceae bacterium]|nr:D-glycero-beta-D-manno-heptose 1,7-bisphosphate 7-phosphatase [Kiritimatiellaceae bacterium]
MFSFMVGAAGDVVYTSWFVREIVQSKAIDNKTQPREKRVAFFLDRDGVINTDHGYVSRIEDFHFTEGIFPVLRGLSAKGYLLIVITNQSGIGRGYYTKQDFEKLTVWMRQRLSTEGIELTAVYSCPHSPDEGCDCRKPAPGMLVQAGREHNLDLSLSWMVGDKESDMQAAEAVGISNRVLLGEGPSISGTHTVSSINELLTLSI